MSELGDQTNLVTSGVDGKEDSRPLDQGLDALETRFKAPRNKVFWVVVVFGKL